MQVVNFHPEAVHSLYEQNGAANATDYTIRSPYPTFHLLRESDVLTAIAGSYPSPELIPSRNAVALRGIGSRECARRFQSFYTNHD